MKQTTKVIFGLNDIENRLNSCIREMNNNGWKCTQIISHCSKQSIYTLLFEKEEEDNHEIHIYP